MNLPYILVGYLIFVWVILRLIVPHLGFLKTPIPKKITPELQQLITEYNQIATDDADFLRLVYEYVTQKYKGSRAKTITHFWKAFGNAFDKSPGFLPCTAQNYILRTMLVKSGRFTESDIEIKTVPLNFFIHQYMKINVGGVLVDVDPWSCFLGVPLGQKSFVFG